MSLSDRISKLAPLRLDHYIGLCLFDEAEGYYATRKVFGLDGDFITAPEISQIFGEIIGAWVVSQWFRIGSPQRFVLCELGAGRGVLMEDALRTIRTKSECADAAQIFILEKSERLRAIQRKKISNPISHLDSIDALPELPTLIISNEFFDALPIRQFRFEDGGWLEAHVNSEIQKTWLPCPLPPKALAGQMHSGQVIEVNEPAIEISQKIGDHLSKHGGAALHFDYGDWDGAGDTLQALLKHEYVDPFSHLGEADLTTHVRFKDLAESARLNTSFMTQNEFLTIFGGNERLAALCAQHPEHAKTLTDEYNRLTSEAQMGKLFKALIWEA